ncbi:unnamed protein product, partial [Meganyctiphanes norvegica]
LHKHGAVVSHGIIVTFHVRFGQVLKMETISGHTITRYEGEELEALRREFKSSHQDTGWVKINPGNWTLPKHFDLVADKIYQFRFRKSDIIINTCPKAGTTWVQEIIWNIINNPNLENPLANSPHFSPDLEIDSFIASEEAHIESDFDKVKSHQGELQEREGTFLKSFDTFPNPRIIKTHIPLTLLPPDTLDCAKVVYVARNPFDVCLSYYHFSRLLKYYNYSGTFEQFAQRFIEGNLLNLPFWEHVYDAWKRRNHHNLHFIFYENLKQDPYKEISKLNTFLETGLTDEQLENIAHFTSFTEMKKRDIMTFGVAETEEHMNMELKEREGGFLRKGVVADWKNYSNQETIGKMKTWIDNSMRNMEIPFIYEIN